MLSRREFCILGGSSTIMAMACSARSAEPSTYQSTLANGFSPPVIEWAGRKWRCNMGSTWHEDMNHCLQLTSGRARFEIRNSPYDRSRNDESGKLRSEISGSLRGDRARLPNGELLWGAMSFIHHPWSDPAGMAQLTGGVHGQVHMGHGFGGSPALAFRRTKDGQFAVTTRGEQEPKSRIRYHEARSFGEVHDLVYRVRLHPSEGSLTVWLDGERIVDLGRASIGSRHADSFWNIGCYYAGGASCPIVAEYANLVYPGRVDLRDRILYPAQWPAA